MDIITIKNKTYTPFQYLDVYVHSRSYAGYDETISELVRTFEITKKQADDIISKYTNGKINKQLLIVFISQRAEVNTNEELLKIKL